MKIRKYARAPISLLLGGALTYLFNSVVLKPIMLNDLEEMGLVDKYFGLDLNADLMKLDLERLGISIKAEHFSMEEAQKQAERKH